MIRQEARGWVWASPHSLGPLLRVGTGREGGASCLQMSLTPSRGSWSPPQHTSPCWNS